MVQAGNPVVNAIRPIISGRRGLAIAIFRQYQAVPGNAVVLDRDLDFITLICGPVELNIQAVRLSLKPGRYIVHVYRINRQLAEIEINRVYVLLHYRGPDFRSRSFNCRKLIVQGNVDVEVRWLPGINEALASLGLDRQRKESIKKNNDERPQSAPPGLTMSGSGQVPHFLRPL